MRFQAVQQVFQPLECSGSAYERGLIQGQSCAKQIQLCFNAFFQSESFELLRPRWLPRGWARRMAALQARQAFAATLRRHTPAVWEQIQGLAAGSGLGVDDFLFVCAAELLLSKIYYQLGGCSTLLIPPRFSSSEEPMLIKNFDYPYFLKAFNLVRQTRPDEGLRSVDVTLAPLVGAHTGMNEAGVALTYNYGYGVARATQRVPVSVRVQQALQQCESAAEVVRFLELGEQEGGAILGVLDTRGDMFLVEVASSKVHSKPIRDNLLIATNHYQLSEMTPSDIPANAYYSFRHNLKELAGRRVRESSESRFDRLYELTGTRVHFHAGDLMGYFQDHASHAPGDDNSICRHGEFYETTCSALLKPLSREIAVAMGNPCEYPYQVYQWI